jgi:hypothetical protein
MLKFDISAIRDRLNQNKEKADNAKFKKKEKDIHTDPLLKVAAAGVYKFRAVPYIHNKDYTSDPFAERFYHFGIPGNAIFYCPSKNTGEKCAICDFVWEQMKENKGNKVGVSKWREFLPKKRVWIPGILRGREAEGLKYFGLSTQDDRMSKHHKQIFDWLQDEDYYTFLDPEVGRDLTITYDAYDDAKSAMFNNAKFGFGGFGIRDKSPISDDPAGLWEEIKKNMKNVDKDLERYEAKTSADAEKVLLAWFEREDKKAKTTNSAKPVDESKDTDGAETVGEDSQPVPQEAKVDSSTVTDAALDRKKKAKDLLAKLKGG